MSVEQKTVELSDFVKRTLSDILSAHRDLRKNNETRGHFDDDGIVNVKFDVSVTAETNDAKGIDTGVKIAIFRAAANGELSQRATSESRISFELPVRLLTAEENRQKAQEFNRQANSSHYDPFKNGNF